MKPPNLPAASDAATPSASAQPVSASEAGAGEEARS